MYLVGLRKECRGVKWVASLEKDIATAAGIDKDYQGHPYLICTPQDDVVGGRNITVNVHGQKDDCETNSLLCGRINPLQWPSVRAYRGNIGIRDDEIKRGGEGGFGPIFTCGEKGSSTQFYGNEQELCVSINASRNNMECEDRYCTTPASKKGFYRLMFNIEFKDSSSCNLYDPAKGCTFVNTRDAKEALGFHYKAWDKDPDRISRYRWTAFPEMPCNFDIECESRKIGSVCVTKSIWSEIPLELSTDPSRDGLCAIPSFVPLCHKNRLLSIVKPKETFAKYPGLRTGKYCYGIVACTPSISCLGDNICAHGYDYARARCLAKAGHTVNLETSVTFENATACETDADCMEDGKLCTPSTPEYCRSCFKLSSSTLRGVCQCSHGAPRCGLCALGLPDYSRSTHKLVYENLKMKLAMQEPPILPSDDGVTSGTFEKRMRELEADVALGFYRRDGECQKCPQCVICIIIGLLALVLLICALAIYFDKEKSKINFAFLSIGVDYFQIISLFAQTGIPWPHG